MQSEWALLLPVVLLAALLIYPGEFSAISTRITQWLYDRGAASYDDKWQRHDYTKLDERIAAAAEAIGTNTSPRVLDLACGSGRGLSKAALALKLEGSYTGVDFSAGMLEQAARNPTLREAGADLQREDIYAWLCAAEGSFDLVLLLEAGEFIREFPQLPYLIAARCEPGAHLVLTRPAGIWAWCFPGRKQSRRALTPLFTDAGFKAPDFYPWRGRYEIVSTSLRDHS